MRNVDSCDSESCCIRTLFSEEIVGPPDPKGPHTDLRIPVRHSVDISSISAGISLLGSSPRRRYWMTTQVKAFFTKVSTSVCLSLAGGSPRGTGAGRKKREAGGGRFLMEASETHIKSFPDPLFTYFVRHESSKSQREKVDESTRAVNDRQEPSKSSCKQRWRSGRVWDIVALVVLFALGWNCGKSCFCFRSGLCCDL